MLDLKRLYFLIKSARGVIVFVSPVFGKSKSDCAKIRFFLKFSQTFLKTKAFSLPEISILLRFCLLQWSGYLRRESNKTYISNKKIQELPKLCKACLQIIFTSEKTQSLRLLQ